MKRKIYLKEILPTAMLFGVVGGGTLIGIGELTTNGLWSILIYPIVMVASMLTFNKRKDIEIRYFKNFLFGCLVFIIMSIVLFIKIRLYSSFSIEHIGGLIKSFLIIVVFAVASSSFLAFFFIRRSEFDKTLNKRFRI